VRRRSRFVPVPNHIASCEQDEIAKSKDSLTARLGHALDPTAGEQLGYVERWEPKFQALTSEDKGRVIDEIMVKVFFRPIPRSNQKSESFPRPIYMKKLFDKDSIYRQTALDSSIPINPAFLGRMVIRPGYVFDPCRLERGHLLPSFRRRMQSLSRSHKRV
jgi:hypothetical protein